VCRFFARNQNCEWKESASLDEPANMLPKQAPFIFNRHRSTDKCAEKLNYQSEFRLQCWRLMSNISGQTRYWHDKHDLLEREREREREHRGQLRRGIGTTSTRNFTETFNYCQADARISLHLTDIWLPGSESQYHWLFVVQNGMHEGLAPHNDRENLNQFG